MQVAISIEKNLFPIQTTIERDGATFPYEVRGYEADYQTAVTRGGIFDFTPFGVVEITGKDATDYLQRMSSLNVKSMVEHQVALGALLTAKAHIVSLGFVQKITSESYQMVVPRHLRQKTLDHLEQFHFGEALEIVDCSDAWGIIGWWNPSAEKLSELGITNLLPGQSEWRRWQSMNLEVWRDAKMESLFWIKVARNEAEKLMFELGRMGISLLGLKTFDYLRVQAGRGWVGLEITDRDIILEANLDDAISRNKGCYPGQEVVERIFTYGQVNRKLLRVELESSTGEFPRAPFAVETWGEIDFWVESPTEKGKAVGLGYIKKSHWASHQSVMVDGVSVRVKDGV